MEPAIGLKDFQLSEDTKKVLQIAQRIATENLNSHLATPHVLKALFHKDIPTREFLINLNKDIFYLEEWAEIRIEELPKATRFSSDIDPDEKLGIAILEADNIKDQLGLDALDAFCLLASISIPGVAFSYDQIRTLPLTKDEIMAALQKSGPAVKNNSNNTNAASQVGTKAPAQSLRYCFDKNLQVSGDNLAPIVGRDKEIRMTLEILTRKSKPNVLIVGDPGVGKTSLVEGLALHIVKGNVPSNLLKGRIFELDMGALLAGTNYKGEIEDRFRQVLQALREYEKPILFIDEIHALADKNKGLSGIINQLKPELTKGEITIVGTATTDDYRKLLEPDETFNRRFEVVILNEPDVKVCLDMVKAVKHHYELYHALEADEDTVEEAIRLSKRYIKQRRLPDAAIDLIDRTMAGIRMMADTSANALRDLKENHAAYKITNETQDSRAKKYYNDIKNNVNYLLLGRLSEFKDVSLFNSDEELLTYLEEVMMKLEEISTSSITKIYKSDLASVVSDKTGIPIGKVQSQEKERLLNMGHHLRKRVVGQEIAIKSVSEAILESRSGLNKGTQPIGAFFLLGPTGTGKTELAKSLSEFLFQDEASMIRFDMSEFKEEHSAALLLGAPPGYVGYEEGGVLVNKIRQQPYSVLLFDEIEKAHVSVFDIFLQIMDEGKLHDRLGKEGDFSNAVILFTSNIGSDFIIQSFQEGHRPASQKLMEIMTKYFRPEFLARLTEIVPFAPISEDVVLDIFNIHLKGLIDKMLHKGIVLEIKEDAKKYLAISGYTPKYGARPLQGVIRDRLRRPLSRMIISEEIKTGDKVVLSYEAPDKLDWKIN